MTLDTNTEFGTVNINSKGMVSLPKKDLTEEQEFHFRESMIKEMYARLYKFGLKTEEIRSKLDKLSMFFGNIGAVSNMSNREIGIVCHMLDFMELTDYKFSK